jgi:hypothetical protein
VVSRSRQTRRTDQLLPALAQVGDIPNAEELLRNWIGNSVDKYSRDLAVSRDGVKAALDFAVEHKMLDKAVDVRGLSGTRRPDRWRRFSPSLNAKFQQSSLLGNLTAPGSGHIVVITTN